MQAFASCGSYVFLAACRKGFQAILTPEQCTMLKSKDDYLKIHLAYILSFNNAKYFSSEHLQLVHGI